MKVSRSLFLLGVIPFVIAPMFLSSSDAQSTCNITKTKDCPGTYITVENTANGSTAFEGTATGAVDGIGLRGSTESSGGTGVVAQDIFGNGHALRVLGNSSFLGDAEVSGQFRVGVTENPVHMLSVVREGIGPAFLVKGDSHSAGDSSTRIDISDMDGGTWSVAVNNDGSFSIHQNQVQDRIRILDNGYVAFGMLTPVFPLQLENGAYCSVGGVWMDASSRDYKDNITDLDPEEALKALMLLKPRKYYYKADREEPCIGFIAEEVPELVATKDRRSLSPMDIIGVLTRVVQVQREEIEAIKVKLNKID